jgi:hypothetical protein
VLIFQMFTASRPKGWPDLHGNIHDLVGGLEHFFFQLFHRLGISSSQLTNSYFSDG